MRTRSLPLSATRTCPNRSSLSPAGLKRLPCSESHAVNVHRCSPDAEYAFTACCSRSLNTISPARVTHMYHALEKHAGSLVTVGLMTSACSMESDVTPRKMLRGVRVRRWSVTIAEPESSMSHTRMLPAQSFAMYDGHFTSDDSVTSAARPRESNSLREDLQATR